MKRFTVSFIVTFLLVFGVSAFAQDELGLGRRGHADAVGSPSGEYAEMTADILAAMQHRTSAKIAPDACTGTDGVISCNTSVSGYFGGSGDCADGGYYMDFWEIAGTAGRTLTITFNGNKPALVAVQDYDTGTILASQTGASPLNLTYVFPSTRKYIIGLSYIGQYLTGAYTLQAVCSGGTTPPGSPNLIPFRPDGWSDKIIVSRSSGTHTDSSQLTSTDTLYIDCAVLNDGKASAGKFEVDIYVDGVLRATGETDSPLDPDWYNYWYDYSIGSLSPGTHTIRMKIDPDYVVAESNEYDNEYTKSFVVSSPYTPPPPPPPPACTANSVTACMLNGRFKVQIRYRNAFDNGPTDALASVKPVTGFSDAAYETGFFYFNNINNIEAVVKLLDQGNTDSLGRRTIAVLFGSATPLRIELTITDTQNNVTKSWTSIFGSQAGQTDFTAFVK